MIVRMLHSLLMAGLLWGASASGAEIIDQGQFFSVEALKAANHQVAELEEKYHHQIHIETYPSAPDGRAAAVAKMSAAERSAFFAKWIEQRAQATKAEGLFLLICQDPPHVHASEDRGLVHQGFTPQARQRVIDALLENFKRKNYDEGLSHALKQLDVEFSKLPIHIAAPPPPQGTPKAGALKPHQPAQPQPQPGGNFGGLLLIGGVILGVIFLISLLGRAFGRGNYGGPGAGMGGGGGFGTGLMGGLLGSLAGSWLYNSFGGHQGHAYGDEHSHANPLSGSSDGSDSFNHGAGGDFGGGDSGGGDF